LLRSLDVSTHLPAQLVSPAGQETAHVPLAQTGPAEPAAEQLAPQTPQFAGSFLVSTQVPLQETRPGAQETTQAPPRHTMPLPQALEFVGSSHAPQWLRSLWTLTHWLAGEAETNFHEAVPSAMLAPVPAGPPLAAEVPSLMHW
jgi:hypothetical protein